MTHLIIYYLGIFTFFFLAKILLEIRKASKTTKALMDVRPYTREDSPKISLIVAARNEELKIEKAVKSLLRQDYPNYEVIVVNDRSTDRTLEILNQVKSEKENLKVVNIQTLPKGWLGKNHALHKGVEESKGDYILFTDADVVFDDSTLKRAMQYMQDQALDHLTLIPDAKMSNLLLNAFLVNFAMMMTVFSRPWKIKDPKSKHSLGIGSFNLFKKEIYEKIGTLSKIKMRPDDDLKLGWLIKSNGFKQDVLSGVGLVSVEWYTHPKELIQGLEKNIFAVFEYRVPVAILFGLAIFWLFIFQFMGLVTTHGLNPIVCFMNVGLLLLIFYSISNVMLFPIWFGFLLPVGAAFQLYILVRSVYLNLKHQGITWRDTKYSLDELKANKQ
jgi:glycosyltransferase involved in cell wall biosynthesis